MNERIKEVRLKEGLSQEKFAIKLGVSRSVIANIEYNKVEAKEYLVNLVVSTFNVSKDWLLNGTGKMYEATKSEREVAELMYELSKENSKLYEIVKGLTQLEPEYFECIKTLIEGLPKKES